MKIYVIGSDGQFSEIKEKIADHEVLKINNLDEITSGQPVIFDFNFDESADSLDNYSDFPEGHLFINATRCTLQELAYFADGPLPNLYGVAADATFLERPVMELTAFSANRDDAHQLIEKLGLNATIVDDRVGMVTPRIIAMIINEAYFTVQEGTASREDIDTAMVLGTNYPMGPFAWLEQWGLANVYELLDALYLDTKEERYKICPLLKREYLSITDY